MRRPYRKIVCSVCGERHKSYYATYQGCYRRFWCSTCKASRVVYDLSTRVWIGEKERTGEADTWALDSREWVENEC